MHAIMSRPVFGNSNNTNKLPSANKIIISPSTASASDASDQTTQAFFTVKEEELSDDDANESSMDFDGSELRPEDLLSVIETEHDNEVEIKEEPMEVETISEIKVSENE
jgi:hypothetical protein